MKLVYLLRQLPILILTGLILSGCGLVEEPTSSTTCDGICSTRPNQTGVFVDSAVGGVTFRTTSGLSGTTNSNGEFSYVEGDIASFSIGDVDLGSVAASAVLTPVEVMGATNTADQSVINLARLLQTLDTDGDPSNGIEITSSTSNALKGKSINFNMPVSSFSNDSTINQIQTAVGRSLTSATAAMAHLNSTMNAKGLTSNIASTAAVNALIDSTPPTILSTSPSNGDNNISISNNIEVSFSEEIDNKTINSTNIIVSDSNGNKVIGTFSYSNQVATFNPSSDLNYFTVYAVIVGTGVKDKIGNALVSGSSWNFTTSSAPDTTPPTIASTSPSGSSNNILISSDITITFSEAIDPLTIDTTNVTLQDSNGNSVGGVVSYNNKIATFDPANDLNYSTTYTVTIGTGVRDTASNNLSAISSWSFTTESPITLTPLTQTAQGRTSGGIVSLTFNIPSGANTVKMTLQMAGDFNSYNETVQITLNGNNLGTTQTGYQDNVLRTPSGWNSKLISNTYWSAGSNSIILDATPAVNYDAGWWGFYYKYTVTLEFQ